MSHQMSARVFNEHGTEIGTRLVIDDEGTITQIDSTGTPSGDIIIPGLVDVHCHGGGGISFPDDYASQNFADGIRVHRNRGTRYLVASLVSMVDPLPAIEHLVRYCESGQLVGIHMEGPYISPHKAGAQNPAAIRPVDHDELERWLVAGKGWIKSMTIAPETPGAEQAAKLLLDHGARPSWGHTDSDSATVAERIESTTAYGETLGIRPAQTATHLFNAMPSLHHRHPGPVRELLAAAARGECVVEVIADGVHLAPELAGDIVTMVDNPEHPGCCLVTDAMAGAGMADGAYQLGGLAVTIDQGVARLTEGGAIAGGTSRLTDQIAILIEQGVAFDAIVRAACATPDRALGLGIDFGMEEGKPFNGVVLNPDYTVKEVWEDGKRL